MMASGQDGWHTFAAHTSTVISLLLPVVALVIWMLKRHLPNAKKYWLAIPLLSLLNMGALSLVNYHDEQDYQRIAPLISDNALDALEDHKEVGMASVWFGLVILVTAINMYLGLKRVPWAPLVFVVVSALGAIPVLVLEHSAEELVLVHHLDEVGRP